MAATAVVVVVVSFVSVELPLSPVLIISLRCYHSLGSNIPSKLTLSTSQQYVCGRPGFKHHFCFSLSLSQREVEQGSSFSFYEDRRTLSVPGRSVCDHRGRDPLHGMDNRRNIVSHTHSAVTFALWRYVALTFLIVCSTPGGVLRDLNADQKAARFESKCGRSLGLNVSR